MSALVVLVIGDGAAPTGYARVISGILRNLPDGSYDIHHLAVNYSGDPYEVPWKLYPAGARGDPYGTNRVRDLMENLRHKLVHLAQLKSQVRHRGLLYSWAFCHEEQPGWHLRIEPGSRPGEFTFCVSILSLAQDIERSVFGPDRYFDRLTAEADLQKNFDMAYGQIMSP